MTSARISQKKFRLLMLSGFFIFAYFGLFARLWHVHILADERISNIEKKSKRDVILSSRRKTIYDRKGRPLALSLKVPSIFVDPKTFMPSQDELTALAKQLHISRQEIVRKTAHGGRRFAWIKRFASPEVEESINALDISGLFVTHEWKRFYPDKELAGQVLGFVGVDGKGLEGLERHFDSRLRKSEVIIRAKKDGRGRVIYSEDVELDFSKDEKDVYLTLDANIQYILEDELSRAAKVSGSKSAMGVMLNSHSGEVLAMASYPMVNPNHFSQFAPALWRNRPVQEVFEPGSTFKVFTVAAALDQKVLGEDLLIHCAEGSLKFGSKEIRNTTDRAWLTPAGILKYSNNVGAARIGLEIDKSRFYDALKNYGFGLKTGIEFPGETRGLLSDYAGWYPIDVANISFGQGIGVSGIQLAYGFSSIANGGFRVMPKLTLDRSHRAARSQEKLNQRIISGKTSDLLKKWLEAVTDEEGTGKRAWVRGYRFAGKTGTAQMIEAGDNSYSHSKLISSFVGMGPLPDAKYVLAISFREPEILKHGGELAAPVFSSVMERTLQYVGVEPQKEVDHNQLMAAHYLTQDSEESARSKKAPDVDHALLPSLNGLTLREVLSFGKKQSIKVNSIGSGLAYDQSVKEGTRLNEVQQVTVYFRSPVGERKI